MKKVLVLLTSFMMLSSVALASPLADFSAGKGSIDLTWRNNDGSISSTTQTIQGKYNLDGAMTIGLGNRFAVQYRDFSPKSKNFVDIFSNDIGNLKMENREINVLYKLNKNFFAYIGNFDTKLKANDLSDPGDTWSSESKNLWQVGIIGTAQFAPKTVGYAQLAAGNDLINWEVGLSYEFAKNTEFNVSYREVKVNKYKIGVSAEDYTTNGFGYGVTYKF